MEGETIMPTITLELGATIATLQGGYNKLLEWNEDESTKVAIKDIPTKTTGTVETEIWTVTPKSINLSCRVTETEKGDLETIKSSQNAASQASLNIDGSPEYSAVWIERLSFKWRGDKDWNAPWLVEIILRKVT